MSNPLIRVWWLTILVVGLCLRSPYLYGRGTIVAGTGSFFGSLEDPAFVYRLDQSGWTNITPPEGIGSKVNAILSFCTFQGRLFASTDRGRIFVYLGDTQWSLTGIHGSEISPEKEVRSLIEFKNELYAGTKPAGLYRYDASLDQWLTVPVNMFQMQGLAVMRAWETPTTHLPGLYLGDIFHDMILRWDGEETDTFKELSILANTDQDGSCIWDFQPYQNRLYACAYRGRIYVREHHPNPNSPDWWHWRLATPSIRGSSISYTWELEVFEDHLYAGTDSFLERVRPDISSPNDLKLEILYDFNNDSYHQGTIIGMVASDLLYIGTAGGNIYAYDGQEDPVKIGNQLPGLLTLAHTEVFAEHPRVMTLQHRLSNCVALQPTISYDIEYSLTGSSTGPVTVVGVFPETLAFQEAAPMPTSIEGSHLTWDLGSLADVNMIGTIALTLSPAAPIMPGTSLASHVILYDANIPFWSHDHTALYDVDHLYVNINNPNTIQDGLSWETAFQTLSDGLRQARIYRIPELWVAQGHYCLPEQLQDGTLSWIFQLPNNTELYGGFMGNEITRDQRSPADFPVVLEGNLSQGDGILSIRPKEAIFLDPDCQRPNIVDGFTFDSIEELNAIPGMYVDTSMNKPPIQIQHCNLRRCSIGIFLTDNSSVSLYNCQFSNTTTGLSAAGPLARINVQDCHFEDNTLAVFLGDSLEADFVNCTFIGNGLRKSPGTNDIKGAIRTQASKLSIADSRFMQNHSPLGAAIYGDPATAANPSIHLTVRHSDFNSNQSQSDGGAIFITDANALLADCWFVGNQAGFTGGALSMKHGNGVIHHCLFIQNSVAQTPNSHAGAASFDSNRGPVTLYRSVFLDNRATYGGALVARANSDQTVHLINCTLAQNHATQWGGGALSVCNRDTVSEFTGGTVAMTNCMIYGNTGGTSVLGSAFEIFGGGSLTLDTCAMDGFWYNPVFCWVESEDNHKPRGTVNAPNPMVVLHTSPFSSTQTLAYHQRENAPSCDHGIALTLDWPLADLDGDLPSPDEAWDIGADEMNSVDLTPPTLQPSSLGFFPHPNGQIIVDLVFSDAFFDEVAPEKSNRIVLTCMHNDPQHTIATLTLSTQDPKWNLSKSNKTGLYNGIVHFSFMASDLACGRYSAQLLAHDPAAPPLARSHTFFINPVPIEN